MASSEGSPGKLHAASLCCWVEARQPWRNWRVNLWCMHSAGRGGGIQGQGAGRNRAAGHRQEGQDGTEVVQLNANALLQQMCQLVRLQLRMPPVMRPCHAVLNISPRRTGRSSFRRQQPHKTTCGGSCQHLSTTRSARHFHTLTMFPSHMLLLSGAWSRLSHAKMFPERNWHDALQGCRRTSLLGCAA